ncbi:hypothetical protein LWI29_029731 [Acer saccharum]|uniref:MULE transposase domain-containing protein n=1 Tax=Acer saccharum TaxID=4024 RepID=A0AA39W6T7_ACESA|nr:hypothetical protein LWI29_029731 [Acer saccharum]
MEFRPVSTAQSIPVSDVFSAIHNDLAISEDVVVPHSLVSNALVVSSDPVASAIFSDSVSLTTSHEQQFRSVNEISIVPGSSAVVPTVPAINSLVQTVSTTMGPSQRPPIPYTTHIVRNDCYGSSQIPSSVAVIRQVIAIDATHLKAKTRGVLLVAVCKDGNEMIYPLAFGFAHSECTESWTWFLKQLQNVIQYPEHVMFVSNHMQVSLLAWKQFSMMQHMGYVHTTCHKILKIFAGNGMT